MKITRNLSFIILALLCLLPLSAEALSGSDWKAGRIIDDAIFTNSSSMSVQEIQQFLNSKAVPCDTYGEKSVTYNYPFGTGPLVTTSRAVYAERKGNPKPTGEQIFTCIKDYYEVPKTQPAGGKPASNYGYPNPEAHRPAGSKSAAQIISDAALAYNISPKVLLVTLQKEQGLVTDDWPVEGQYLYAMGAQCPDGPNGAQCDPAYASFSLQMHEGASLFRYYLDNMEKTWWQYKKPFKTNNILFQVSSEPNCGSSSVYIESRATAALYTYTPYQPNQAALNNLYGTGDRCSAYGNRNFWRLFNDWFGNTRLAGVKPSHESKYASSPCSPPSIPSLQVARLYNPDTKDYLLTNSGFEACVAKKIGYIWDGIVFNTVSKDTTGASPVYRLSGYERHIYTSSEEVKSRYLDQGYKDEGISFYAYTSQNAAPELTNVYCLVKDDQVFYTASDGERVGLQQQGFSLVGIAFLVPQGGTIDTASRFVDNLNKRLHSSNSIEKAQLPSYGYQKENQDFNVDRLPGVNNSPVYRLRNPAGQYFFTSSRIERDVAVINYDYFSEGVAFYTPGNSSLGKVTIYRLVNPTTALRFYTTSVLERDLAISKHGYKSEGEAWYGY